MGNLSIGVVSQVTPFQPETFEGLVNGLVELCETIAGAEWLDRALSKPANHPLLRHPLVLRWSLAKAIRDHGWKRFAIGGPDDAVLPWVRTVLDATAIKIVYDALGEHNYLFRRLAETFRDSAQFSNTMVELSAAAWCISRGFPVEPCAGDAMPEFSILGSEDRRPIYVECKRVEAPVAPEQLRRQLQRANRKTHALSPEALGPLALIIDISGEVGRTEASSTPPDTARRCIEIVSKQIQRAKYRNISAICFTWHNVAFLSPAPDRSTTIALQRVSNWISHPHARRPFLAGNPMESYGFTVEALMEDIRGPRNGPCFCGSGERFKRCHGKLV